MGNLDYVENMGLARKVHTATVHMKHAFRVFAYLCILVADDSCEHMKICNCAELKTDDVSA